MERLARMMDLHGIGQSTMVQLTGGAFLTGYLLSLGASELVIGLVAALPLMAKITQLYTSWRIELQGQWWRSAFQGAVLGRLPLLAAAVLPFVPIDHAAALWLLIAAIAASSLGGSIFEISFLTWMAELIPVNLRGTFWRRRVRVSEIAGVVSALLAAFAFDRWHAANPEQLDGFAVLFGIGAVSGLIALLFLRRIPRQSDSAPMRSQVSFLDVLRRPAADANFRRLLVFISIWGFAVGFVGPYTNVLMLREMGLPFLAVTFVNIIPAGMMALMGAYWGRLSDHFGNKPIVRLASYIIGIMPVFWMLAAPGRNWPLVLVQVISGIGWAAYNISINHLVLKIAPDRSRSSYVASVGVTFAATQAVSPLIAGVMFEILLGRGVAALHIYYLIFAISMVLRLAATPLLRGVKEPGGRAVGDLIRVMSRFRSIGATPATDLIYSYGYTHLARLADFITREPGELPSLRRRRQARRRRRGRE